MDTGHSTWTGNSQGSTDCLSCIPDLHIELSKVTYTYPGHQRGILPIKWNRYSMLFEWQHPEFAINLQIYRLWARTTPVCRPIVPATNIRWLHLPRDYLNVKYLRIIVHCLRYGGVRKANRKSDWKCPGHVLHSNSLYNWIIKLLYSNCQLVRIFWKGSNVKGGRKQRLKSIYHKMLINPRV